MTILLNKSELLEKTIRWITILGVMLGLVVGVAQPQSSVQADKAVCATPGKDGPVTITAANTIVNTYYPGTGTVAAGATSITVDNANRQGSASQIDAGDLLLVIQMQGAEIDSTQSNAYGDGVAGVPASGQLNNANFNAGRYEYVVATSNAASGTIGISSPLIYGYDTSAATAILGERSFQVIRVPQYSDLTINNGASITSYAWTSTASGVTSKVGGVVAVDVSGIFSLGGGTVINVAGQGFRAGGGWTTGGSASGSFADVRTISSSLNQIQNASKGEGIAGTPRYLYAGGSWIDRGAANEGYPNGAMARGAPGNAGGGGTDGNPAANDQNTGGGGGSNGGSGGKGGFSWNTVRDSGGFGGAAFPLAANRLVMGGGGGAGTINNNNAILSSGGPGGGIVMVRAGSVTGTGTINANGNAAPGQPLNDSGGGGGAGGSVLLIARNAALPAGLNITATGGRGGDAWPGRAPGTPGELTPGSANARHGPGGGGGGGTIFLSSTAGTLAVTGGAHGITTTANSTFGSEDGNPGTINTSTTPGDLPGSISGAGCTDLAITKSNGTTSVNAGGTTTYTVRVTNNGPSSVINAILSDPAAAGLSKTAVACSATPGQCVTSPTVSELENSPYFSLPALASSDFYEITISADVTATSGSVINTATVAPPTGTTDLDTTNNSASDTDTVTSVADLAVSKTVDNATPNLGDNVTFTVTVTNNGPSTATGVSLSDTLPAGLTYVSSTPSQGTYSNLTGVWTVGSLASSASATLDITASVNAIGLLTNTAAISASDQYDPVSTNNSASASVTATQADLEVSKTDNPDPVTVNGNFTYTITVTNDGPDDSSGVVVVDNLPSSVVFVSANPSTDYDESTGEWTIGTLANSASATLQITVTAPSSAQTVLNTATVSSDTFDPNLNNNFATESTTVQQIDPDALDKTLTATSEDFTDLPETAIGEVLTYQVEIIVPPGTFNSASVVDTLDQGLAFVACDNITPSSAGLTASTTFADICASPGVAEYPSSSTTEVDQGRQVTYDFGTLINSTTGDITLTITYRVVVLNAVENVQDADPPVSLNNAAVFSWDASTPILDSADPVSIVEPDLSIQKSATPTFVRVGDTVTYTITIRHTGDSNTNAYDTLMQDVVPVELGIILSTLNCNAGAQSANTCAYDAGTRTVAAGWDNFTLSGGTGVVRFQATVLSLPTSGGVTNTAAVEWTSLPGDPGQLSPHNVLSTERYYDPGDPANTYGVEDSFTLNALTRGVALPATGFAPGVVTRIGVKPQGVYSTQNGLTLEIPALKVSLPVMGIPLQHGAWDLTWLSRQAGWLEGSSYPTLDGNSVLTAHVYLPNGKAGPFVNLNKLSWGQEVAVVSNGLRYVYQVREVRNIKPDDMTVFKHEEKSWLTLLTCKEFDEKTNTYRSRLMVRAVLMRVENLK